MKQRTKKWLLSILAVLVILITLFALYSHFYVFDTSTPIGAIRKEVFHSGYFYSAYVLTAEPAKPEDAAVKEWYEYESRPEVTVYKLTSHIPVSDINGVECLLWTVTKEGDHYSCEEYDGYA